MISRVVPKLLGLGLLLTGACAGAESTFADGSSATATFTGPGESSSGPADTADATTGASQTDGTTETTGTADTTIDTADTTTDTADTTTDGTTTSGETEGEATCGNGVVEELEECDDGEQNADTAACKSDCTLQVCGDGAVGPEEACDDGNAVDNDDCSNACALPVCGDGNLQAGEECDGEVQNGTCSACTVMCDSGFDDCDGDRAACELDVTSDPLNCGSCGHACSDGVECIDAQCRWVIGNSEEFVEASSHGAHYLLGSQLNVPVPITLTDLVLIAKQGGPFVQMALYADVGGEPGPLVASTAATAVVPGVMELAVTEEPLPAGDYWIMGVFDVEASIGINFSDAAAVVKYTSHQFGAPLPDPFPAPTTYEGQMFNYYLLGYE